MRRVVVLLILAVFIFGGGAVWRVVNDAAGSVEHLANGSWSPLSAWVDLGHCTYGAGGTEPDPRCTPGAADPTVTQANIASTICRTGGYSPSVRPPAVVTEPQKFASMHAYGSTGTPSAYEFDHLIPLELGGAPDTAANLWPEPLAGPQGALVKDQLENRLHDLVCDDHLPLAAAQQAIATDWIAGYGHFVTDGATS